MLVYCQLDPEEQTSVKFWYKQFLSWICIAFGNAFCSMWAMVFRWLRLGKPMKPEAINVPGLSKWLQGKEEPGSAIFSASTCRGGVFHRPGPWFNIKMSSYQYRKFHCGDKTVVRSSYLHNGISYTESYTESTPCLSEIFWVQEKKLDCLCPQILSLYILTYQHHGMQLHWILCLGFNWH